MKIYPMSDLHLEHHKDYGESFVKSLPDRTNSIAILAGDIISLAPPINHPIYTYFKSLCAKYKHVLMVPGNHEYYGTSPIPANSVLTALKNKIPNLMILTSDKPVTIEGQRFIGDTLWFPDDPLNILYQRQINDFSCIENFIPWVYYKHKETVENFSKLMLKGDIVVTHHGCSFRHVPDKYKTAELNRFFFCNLDDLILSKQPEMWIYGHTHEPLETERIHYTKIIRNPFGYPGENLDFKHDLSFTL